MAVQSPQDLYGLPLSRFTPERDTLAKSLRKDKRRDEATAVARMRKPSVAAWAVNQLVRTQSKAMRGLFKAGDDLAQAQSRVASGKASANSLREATPRLRNAIDDLIEAAEGLLSSNGHPLTATTLDRVRDTLRAASIDEASREQVKQGCLLQELQFAGLGIGGEGAAPREGRVTQPKRAAKQRDDDNARRAQAERERERARERKAALTAARKAEAKARTAATRAEKGVVAAQAQRDETAASREEAEELLKDAAERAAQAARELKTAERDLAELEHD